MELNDIKTRDDLKSYWLQLIWKPVWDAQEIEKARKSLLPVAKKLGLEDWVRYLEAMERYIIDDAASEARLSAFMVWARGHRENIEDWLFAHAQFCLGRTQGKLKKTSDSLKNYDELVAGFRGDSDKTILITVARALFAACNIASESGGKVAAGEYLKGLRDFAKKHDEPAIREQLANALYNEFNMASESSETSAANEHFEELRKLAEAHDEPAIREALAKALCNASVYASESSETSAANKYLKDLRKLAKTHDEPAIRGSLAGALFNAFYHASESSETSVANEHFEELRKLAEAHDEPAIREALAKALCNAFVYASESSETAAAKKYFEEMRKLAEAHDEPAIREKLATALFNAFYYASKSSETSAANEHFEELRKLAEAHDEPAIRGQLANALYNAFNKASESSETSAANKYLKDLRKLAKTHDEPAIREPLANALFNHSISLERAGKNSDAYVACADAEDLLRQITDEDTKLFREHVAIRANDLHDKLDQTEKESVAERRKKALADAADEMTRSKLISNLRNVINELTDVKDRFLAQMERGKHRIERFLNSESRFQENTSVLMVLRQWNSYTPIIVDGQEYDRGGGYFVRYKNVGLVIDPGYNFIELFHKAGCKIFDITHVAITHAHDDHTAQLEQLLTMFHQFNRTKGNKPKKVTLLLNHSTLKKFSGFSLHKDCPYIGEIICLNAFDPANVQTIRLLPKADNVFLTVLPAYHDDVFTMDYAVGLGLRIGSGKESRRIVFTGDTGLYPLKRDSKGELVYYEYFDSKGHPVKERRVNEAEEGGINRLYPKLFQAPKVDLLVPHMGSIKEYEFNPLQDEFIPPSSTSSDSPGKIADSIRDSADKKTGTYDLKPMFYPNHLGVLGTAMVIKELRPKAVILSEFGSELRGLRMEIASLLSKALAKHTGDKPAGDNQIPPIIPGDPSIVYNIQDGTFLCHEDGVFRPGNEIETRDVGKDRIGLFKKGSPYASLERFDKYQDRLVNSEKEDTEPFKLSYMKEPDPSPK